jgi:hypothetical protein
MYVTRHASRKRRETHTTMTTQRKPRVKKDDALELLPPERISSAADRGYNFDVLIRRAGMNQTSFAAVVGLNRVSISRYVAGEPDLADVSQPIAEKLLTGLGMSDRKAREVLGIPESSWHTFRSFRDRPVDAGETKLQPLELDAPTAGTEIISSGATVMLDPHDMERGTQVIRLMDGRYYTGPVSLLASAQGQRLGRLRSVTYP